MAGRIRSIKPEILEDEKTAALSHLEWRLFVSLWLIADDHGNLRGEPGYVQGQTLWAANETRAAVADALEVLAAVGLLTPYTVRGQSYCHITGWAKHQRVDKPGKPRMPGPNESDAPSSRHVAPTRDTFAESSRESREGLEPDLRPPTSDQDHDRESLARTIPRDGGQQGAATPGQGATAQGAVPAAGNVAEPPPSPGPSVPAASPPSPAREDIARTRPAAPLLPGPLVTAPAEIAGLAFNADDPRARARLAEATYRRVSDALVRIAAELKLPAPLPFPAITPASSGRLRELLDRVREEGADAPLVCDRVVENLIAQAREERSVEWLAEKAFTEGAWRTARTWMPGAAARRRGPARGDPLPPAPPPKRPEPPPPDPVLSPEDRAEMLALAARVGANPEAAAAELAGRPSSLPTAELVKRFGDGPRAPPDDPITDEPRKPPARRKAGT